MGNTIIEKILKLHSSEEVKPGKIIWIDIDVRSARDFGGANVVKNFQKHFGTDEKVHDNSKTFFTFDCNVPANTIPYANNQQICRDFAKEQDIKLYDVDAGIGSHVVIDEGLALPSKTVVGTDSHLNILGAVGCFGQGMGDMDIAFTYKTGKTWFEVPPTMKINLKGNVEYPATAKDIVLAMLQELGSAGALGRSVELYGKAIDNLTLDGRITVSSMGTEMGAIISFIEPNKEIVDFFNTVSQNDFVVSSADKEAEYVEVIDLNIDGLKPMVAMPPKPDNVKEVSEVKNLKVDSIFIGSCTNGRMEDMKMAAEILKGNKVAPHVMLKVVPSTRKIYGEMMKEGMLEIFFESGAIVSNPGCGGCASGQIGMTGKGEVQLSTSNRNFRGKQGDGDTYLVSPATAAASAIAGELVSPK